MKERFNKKTIWTLFSFVIIGIGLYFVIFIGYLPMHDVEKNTDSNTPLVNGHLPNLLIRNYEIPEQKWSNGLVSHLEVTIISSNNELFVGDNVYFVSLSAFAPPITDVAKIYVIFANPHIQLHQSYNLTEAINEIDYNIPITPTVELVPKANQTKGTWIEFETVPKQSETGAYPPFAFPTEGVKIAEIFAIHNNGEVDYKSSTDPIFTVHANSERLQAIQISEQQISDAKIIGLSWIGIGLAFVIVGSDIFLRIYLEPYTEDMKNESFFRRKLPSS